MVAQHFGHHALHLIQSPGVHGLLVGVERLREVS
jgi:hypothetical protein